MQRTAALIGTGGIAEAHAAAFHEAGERVNLVAAVDIDANRAAAFAAKHGIPHHYTDTAAMLAAHGPDLVSICTPPATHTDLTLQCMEAGAWVLCEKPLVASLAELDAITTAEARTGCYAASIFQIRFGSGAQHLKRLIDAGELGRPLVGLCQTLWYRDAAYYAVPWRGKWATELGGTIMIHGIHQIDLGLWLLGDWVEVHAATGTLDHDIEVEDVAMGIARMENGALLNIVSSAVSPRQVTYTRLDFQKATVELRYLYSYDNGGWRYSVAEHSPHADALAGWTAIPENVPAMQAAQLGSFLDSMDRGERPVASGGDVRRTMEFVTALYKAGLTGQPVQRGSITPDDPFYHAMNGGH